MAQSCHFCKNHYIYPFSLFPAIITLCLYQSTARNGVLEQLKIAQVIKTDLLIPSFETLKSVNMFTRADQLSLF